MDEEEAFKRAIEESKGNRYDDEGNGGTRKGKRGRERSEEYVLMWHSKLSNTKLTCFLYQEKSRSEATQDEFRIYHSPKREHPP